MFHVIDDQAYIADVLCEIIESFGHQTRAFTSPHDYIEYVKSSAFQMPFASFTDVDMPSMNGYEMMQTVQRLHPEIRFVITTGDPTTNHQSKQNACIYLTKPFHPGTIDEITAKLVQCFNDGPSATINCCDSGARRNFSIPSWSCPHDAS